VIACECLCKNGGTETDLLRVSFPGICKIMQFSLFQHTLDGPRNYSLFFQQPLLNTEFDTLSRQQ